MCTNFLQNRLGFIEDMTKNILVCFSVHSVIVQTVTNCSMLLHNVICWPICASPIDAVLLLVNRLKTDIFRECILKIALTRSIFQPKMH